MVVRLILPIQCEHSSSTMISRLVFIDNQAISAGALIAVAADSIYMRSGPVSGQPQWLTRAGSSNA